MPEKLSLELKTENRGRTHLALLEATREAHCLLDQRWGDRASLASREGYTKFLMANWPVVSIEVALEAAGIHRLLLDWDQRSRRNALAHDLGLLGLRLSGAASPNIPRDNGTLLGWCYVLEGSRLGGHLIKNILRSTGDKRLEAAMSFVSHGISCDYWRSFKTTLARIDDDEAAIDRACAGAIVCFDNFLLSDQ